MSLKDRAREIFRLTFYSPEAHAENCCGWAKPAILSCGYKEAKYLNHLLWFPQDTHKQDTYELEELGFKLEHRCMRCESLKHWTITSSLSFYFY